MNHHRYEQAVLDLAGPLASTFEHYHAGPNATVTAALRHAASNAANNDDAQWVYLQGAVGSGRTHLLLATCNHAREHQRTAYYFSLDGRQPELSPQHLQGLEQAALIALDDIDAIAARPAWEESLFHLLNRWREAGVSLIMSAVEGPGAAGFQLPDLRSRLGWGQRYRLQPLSDEDLAQVLAIHADARGLPLDQRIINYLLTHASRDTRDLLQILDRLRQAVFADKRRPSLRLAAEIVAAWSSPSDHTT
ncbi:MAG: DnaA inactivator Hda [Wenzhouxiangellaceae bacterium]